MVKSKSSYIAALDIGSNKILCLIAKLNSDEEPTIIGIGHQESQGIRSGVITDIQKAETAIRAALSAAEHMAEVNIENVIVNISGAKQQSHLIRVQIPVAYGMQINERDIQRLIQEGCKQFRNEECHILHCIPLDFSIDDNPGITDPKGMYGSTLSAQLHIVTACASTILNLTHCLAHCQLDVNFYVTSAYASSYGCLNEEEKKLGCMLIEFGGTNTTISTYKNGHMTYIDTVPIGGAHITNDIALGLTTSLESAERLKNLYGCLFNARSDDKTMLDIEQIGERGTKEHMQISRRQLIEIIKPRAEEIMEMVKKHIDHAAIPLNSYSVIITGGGSQLSGLKEYVTQYLNKQIRLGTPFPLKGLKENSHNPSFSTAVGMLRYNVDKLYSDLYDVGQYTSGIRGTFSTIMRWMKENF